ncbi:MAG: hypothetical protein LBM27_03845 [Lactobacillaceae bacterium]|jgi:hypothetical protein|nr:hypothetical protein [Lactobacillaceae bacterium]
MADTNKREYGNSKEEIPVIQIAADDPNKKIEDNIEERLQEQRHRLTPEPKKNGSDYAKIIVSFVLGFIMIFTLVLQTLRSLHLLD